MMTMMMMMMMLMMMICLDYEPTTDVSANIVFDNEIGHVSIYKAPLAAAITPLLISLFPIQPMACEVNKRKGQTTPGTTSPTLIEQ